ncbi:hypothetical protein [Pseudomonas sp. 58 R 3]|nr:hypothetical protein [Pseudomonas sp. 58 R 3]
MQAGDADHLLPGLGPQASAQVRVQHVSQLMHVRIALDILMAERQGRLIQIAEHVAKEPFVLLHRRAQACLGHIVAVGHRRAELLGTAVQTSVDLLVHHLHGHVVNGDVMEQQHRHPALVARVFAENHAQQRRAAQVHVHGAGVEALVQLLGNRPVGRVERHLVDHQLRLAPDHLHRLIQALPDNTGAQDIVTIDHLLQSLGKRLQAWPRSDREL